MENLIKKLSAFYEDAENGKCLTPTLKRKRDKNIVEKGQ